jgi:low temperature requirement protein LtrA
VSLTSAPRQTPRLLRDRSGTQRVTNIELFFDLVYVFAVTQLSHYLLGHADLRGALRAGLLLLMVWLVWAYTTWVTNWLDPDLMAVRLLLVALMLVVWRHVPWTRIAGIAVLALLGLAAKAIPELGLAACAAGVIAAVAACDRVPGVRPPA